MRWPSQGTHATCHAAMVFLPRHCPHVELKAFRTYGVNFSWQDFTNLIGDIMEYHQRIYIYIYCIIYILPHETCLLFHIIYYITQRIFTRKDVGHTVSNQLTFGLVSKWAIPQISALGSGTWWLLYNQWMTRGNVFGQTQVVMGHNHHGYPWIGMDSGFG